MARHRRDARRCPRRGLRHGAEALARAGARAQRSAGRLGAAWRNAQREHGARLQTRAGRSAQWRSCKPRRARRALVRGAGTSARCERAQRETRSWTGEGRATDGEVRRVRPERMARARPAQGAGTFEPRDSGTPLGSGGRRGHALARGAGTPWREARADLGVKHGRT
ncbi:hypothetical protein Scep_013161 [Stephania cephalantha]|uniref:Uncharacterized protein n=1 Tax=Stephania cephalantha TaxID=152367 RepID=A0AAP0JGH8_9MAGN